MRISAELMKKAENAILDNKLVGEVSFCEEEYEALLEYTRGYSLCYSRGIGSFLGGNEHIHFVTLIEIAKRWKRIDDDENDERGFWEFVFKTLVGIESYDQKLYKSFTDLIGELGRTKKILFVDYGKKYWAALMMHAFAPIRSINAFLDLCYNIYRKDLNFNYTENDKGICEIATIRFCEILQSSVGNDTTISIGSNTYGVKVGLRTLALNEATQYEFVNLLDKTLENIDKLFHRKVFTPKSYFEGIINDWWQNKLAEVSIDRKTGNRSSAAVTKKNITAKFIRNDNKVNLVIPPIRLDSKGSTVWLAVYAGEKGEKKYSDELYTRYGELTITTMQKAFDLNELLQEEQSIKIRVEITENDIVLYDKVIEREFILFEGESEVLSQLNKSSNYFVYTRDIDALIKPTEIQNCGSNLYNIYPKAGETLASTARQVFFVDQATVTNNKNTVRLLGSFTDCEWKLDDIACLVFGGGVQLLMPHDTDLNGLALIVDTKRLLLSKLPYLQDDGYILFDISDLIPKCEPTEIVVYSHQKEKQLVSEYIVVFPNLNIGFSRSAYYGKDEKKLKISVDEVSKDLYWENSDNEVIYPFNEGCLVIKIPYIRWRVDDKPLRNEPLNNITWYKDYFHNGSLLEIDSALNMDDAVLYALENRLADIQHIVERNKTTGKFEIGRYIYSQLGKTEIMFLLKPNNQPPIELLIVSTEEHFEYPPLNIMDDKAVFMGDDSFIGEIGRKFSLEFKRVGREDQYFESDKLEKGIVPISEGIYWVTVKSKSAGMFAKADKVFWQGEFVLGDRDKLKLVNLVYRISPIAGIGYADVFWQSSKNGYRISDLKRINSENPDVFSARIYHDDGLARIDSKTPVGGADDCSVTIISPSALQVLVKDDKGNYTQKLTFERGSKKIKAPNIENLFSITNYYYLEVKDV